MKTFLFINPQLNVNLNDTFTTGIVYMPFVMIEALTIMRNYGFHCKAIDLFAEGTDKAKIRNNFMVVGEDTNYLNKKVNNKDENHFIIFANQIINHKLVKDISLYIKNNFNYESISILENSEAVTSYSIENISKEFTDMGINYLITGNVEESIPEYLKHFKFKLIKKNSKIVFLNKRDRFLKKFQSNKLELYWDSIPLEKYWSFGFGHGPITNKKYLPLLTSKGCPYPCEFCVMPKLSSGRWLSKSAINIFYEMSSYHESYGVTEFHIEDTNPMIDSKKFVELSNMIIQNKKKFSWKFVSGTKVETFKSYNDLKIMSDGGLKYVSFSPESGSLKIRKLIGKKFNISHSINFIKWCRNLKINTQACFVLGFEQENINDILKTFFLLCRYTVYGIDEVAFFIITPIPGSKLYFTGSNINTNNDEFSFSPTWRNDYFFLNLCRFFLYSTFLFLKLIFHPINFFRTFFKILLQDKSNNLKMEAAPLRSIYYKKLKSKYV